MYGCFTWAFHKQHYLNFPSFCLDKLLVSQFMQFMQTLSVLLILLVVLRLNSIFSLVYLNHILRHRCGQKYRFPSYFRGFFTRNIKITSFNSKIDKLTLNCIYKAVCDREMYNTGSSLARVPWVPGNPSNLKRSLGYILILRVDIEFVIVNLSNLRSVMFRNPSSNFSYEVPAIPHFGPCNISN